MHPTRDTMFDHRHARMDREESPTGWTGWDLVVPFVLLNSRQWRFLPVLSWFDSLPPRVRFIHMWRSSFTRRSFVLLSVGLSVRIQNAVGWAVDASFPVHWFWFDIVEQDRCKPEHYDDPCLGQFEAYRSAAPFAVSFAKKRTKSIRELFYGFLQTRRRSIWTTECTRRILVTCSRFFIISLSKRSFSSRLFERDLSESNRFFIASRTIWS